MNKLPPSEVQKDKAVTGVPICMSFLAIFPETDPLPPMTDIFLEISYFTESTIP